MRFNSLIPELDVADIERSLSFYVGILGFEPAYTRDWEGFAFLVLGDAQIMLDSAPHGRRFDAVSQGERGRGLNLQIAVDNLDEMLSRITAAGLEPLIPPETKIYQTGSGPVSQNQFVIQDPDGYLLRFVSMTTR